MRPPRLRALLANALAIAAGLVVALALAEIGTRLFAPQPLSGSWLVYGPRGMLMNKAGGGPVRNELVGHDAVFYDFNAWHQRGRNEPDPGAARVLVLGDSFTFGFGLAVEDTFVARLQAMLDERGAGARSTVPRVQLLNASAGGWGTADQLTYLEAFGDRLAPSAVVVFVNFGDASRSIRSGLYSLQADRQGLAPVDQSARRSRAKLPVEGNGLYNFLLEHSHLVQLVRVAGATGFSRGAAPAPFTGQEQAAEQELARRLFRRMAGWCRERDVQLSVLTTGWPIFRFPWLAAMLGEEGIWFRDLHDPVTAAIGGRLADYEIAGDGHPNQAGDRLIAEAAWPILDPRLAGLPARPFPGR